MTLVLLGGGLTREAFARPSQPKTRALIYKSYDDARSELAKQGIYPLLLPIRDKDAGCWHALCVQYKEFLRCYAPGNAHTLCYFALVNPETKQKYRVETDGEYLIVTKIEVLSDREMTSEIKDAQGFSTPNNEFSDLIRALRESH